MSFTVAIIGRPNVGKSTLFNRLTGTKHAIVDDTPGVTRDRREGAAHIADLHFRVFDTAGLEEAEENTLTDRMTKQTLNALKDADVVLMVMDGRAGVTPLDKQFALTARKSGKPVVLVVNKAEGKVAQAAMNEAYSLGFKELVPISAEHGEGMGELYSALAPFAKDTGSVGEESFDDEEESDEDNIFLHKNLQIAVVGRPNAGKSTLINTLLGEERVLTGPEAGITRDSIAVPFTYKDKNLTLVDTAGMRKKASIDTKLERLSVSDTLRSIQYAQVVVLVLDATQALEKQDNMIASLVEREGRAMVIALNKWDLVKDKTAYMKEFELRLAEQLPQIRGVPMVPISAHNGKGVDRLIQSALDVLLVWAKRVPTGQLNRFLEAALEKHAPPLINGRRLKIRYMTQAKSRPPTFVLASNMDDSEVPDHYLRYLINGLREAFGMHGVPIRIKVKKNKNPYEVKE